MAKFITFKREPQPENNAQEEIKVIPTEYNGCRFRSRTEARWAVFFDACGVKWEYEPEGFNLNGLWYLPDFLLHDVCFVDGNSGMSHDLFVEIKGNPKEEDGKKVYGLRHAPAVINCDDCCKNAIVVLGNIPYGRNLRDLRENMLDEYDETRNILCKMWSLEYVFGIRDAIIPAAGTNGKLVLMNDTFKHVDEAKTVAAYDAARQAQFEHGAKPNVQQQKELDIHEFAKEHMNGKVAIDAIKLFVPADFCKPSKVGSTEYYEELVAVELICNELYRLVRDKKTREWFICDNFMDYWDGFIKNRLHFPSSHRSDIRVGRLQETALTAFDKLISSGFKDTQPKRSEFWNKFLRQHIDGSFGIIYHQFSDWGLSKEIKED